MTVAGDGIHNWAWMGQGQDDPFQIRDIHGDGGRTASPNWCSSSRPRLAQLSLPPPPVNTSECAKLNALTPSGRTVPQWPAG